jgi:membrane fusion protein, heavy metal efflux system
LVQNKQTFNTRQLNGRVVTSGKVAASNSPFIQLQFEIDGHPAIIAGSYADVYLITSTISKALVVPSSALVEEQGAFYLYVQTGGESFQKREVKPGISDGVNVQILSGISEGERVVTKGAFQIKLSSASGALPAHGHEH